MIITRTPLRISFFGGGSDYKEWLNHSDGEVISSTINKYIYINIRLSPCVFTKKYRISYSKNEVANHVNEIEHYAIKGMLRYFKNQNGLEIHYNGDLPSRSGVGSSSAFVVGFLKAYESLVFKKKMTPLQLAKKSIFFEQKILKENVGIQDQIACSFGGFNNIKMSKNKIEISKFNIGQNNLINLNSNLFLVYTNIQRTANLIASSFTSKLHKTNANILSILNQVNQAKILLKKGKLDEFGELMGESWIIKKNLSYKISNQYLDEIYFEAIKSGAIGGKLLGAGGGGFFLFYVPKKNQYYFKKNFLRKNLHVDFKFETEGSKIIYNEKN